MGGGEGGGRGGRPSFRDCRDRRPRSFRVHVIALHHARRVGPDSKDKTKVDNRPTFLLPPPFFFFQHQGRDEDEKGRGKERRVEESRGGGKLSRALAHVSRGGETDRCPSWQGESSNRTVPDDPGCIGKLTTTGFFSFTTTGHPNARMRSRNHASTSPGAR